jgi:hypothetical protein
MAEPGKMLTNEDWATRVREPLFLIGFLRNAPARNGFAGLSVSPLLRFIWSEIQR